MPTKDVVGLGKACDAFIASSKDQPFFLTLALGDPHPNGMEGVAWGVENENGYTPVRYEPAKIEVPDFLPDTPTGAALFTRRLQSCLRKRRL